MARHDHVSMLHLPLGCQLYHVPGILQLRQPTAQASTNRMLDQPQRRDRGPIACGMECFRRLRTRHDAVVCFVWADGDLGMVFH